jgi:hypothetical protein
MSNRITNADLDKAFEYLANIARNRGVDVSGWSFGQHYGKLYQIRDSGRDRGQIISNQWATKREAWQGMFDMAEGLMLIPFHEVEA